jgi:hypothetical protein
LGLCCNTCFIAKISVRWGRGGRRERKTGLLRRGDLRDVLLLFLSGSKRRNMQIQFTVFKGCAIAADAAALKRSF